MVGFARNLNQDATHWPVTGSDGYGGFTYGAPVRHDCRWQDKNELFLTPDNEEVVSAAIVYLNTDIAVGDFLAEGDYATEPVVDPGTISTAKRVRNFGKSTDLRALVALRKAWL